MNPILTYKNDIENWLAQFQIDNYTINSDMSVDVRETVYLNNRRLTSIDVQFGVIDGSFHCDHNRIESLRGAPKIVTGSFECQQNVLTNLKGGPQQVNKNYNCSYNRLLSLEGAPQMVGVESDEAYSDGSFECSHNALTSLEFCPQTVKRMNATHNQINTLEFFPLYIQNKYAALVPTILVSVNDNPNLGDIQHLKTFDELFQIHKTHQWVAREKKELNGFFSTKEPTADSPLKKSHKI